MASETEVAKTNILILIALVLFTFHIVTFSTGFRLTADDVMFAEAYFSGLDAIWALTEESSRNQGRIGYWVLQPINMFGAYYAEYLIMRILFSVIYFVTFLYAVKVICDIIDHRLFPLSAVFFLALHPLAYEHLPPNSYPLQNSVAILMLLLGYSALITPQYFGRRLLGGTLVFLSTLLTEYAFIFCFSLLVLRIACDIAQEVSFGRSLKKFVEGTNLTLLIILALSLVPYRVYRKLFTSTYEGNVIPESFNLLATLKVASLHIIDGTSLRRIAQFLDHSTAILVILTVLILWLLKTWTKFSFRIEAPHVSPLKLAIVNLSLIAILYILTLPLSYSNFQIETCDYNPFCGYLDSRSAFVFISVFLSFNIGFILSRLSSRLESSATLLLVAVIVIVSSYTQVHNFSVRERMHQNDIIWERARQISCYISDTSDGPYLSDLIDPLKIVPFHTAELRNRFWGRYIAFNRDNGRCGLDEILVETIRKS